MMSRLLPELSTSANFGLNWPTWIAMAGFVLFCLLGFYATMLLLAGKHLPARLRILQLPSLRGRMLLGFVLVATLPAMSLGLVLSDRATNERLEAASTQLTTHAETLADTTEFFLQHHIAELGDAAAAIQPRLADPDLPIEEPMIAAHRVATGMLLMTAADTSGRVIATTRKSGDRVEASGARQQTMLRKSYFTEPMRTGEPFISGGLQDPEGKLPLAAAIGVPIVAEDESVTGVLIGFYDLGSLARAQSALGEHSDIRAIMLDGTGQVIFSGATSGFSTRDELAGDPILTEATHADGQPFSFRLGTESTGISDGYLATSYPMNSGWQWLLYRPLQPIEFAVFDEYAVSLAWLAGALLISICLALALLRSLCDPLRSLDESVHNFKFDTDHLVSRLSPDAPREVTTIFEHLGSLDERLRLTYGKLRNTVQQGEKLRGELIHVIAQREKEIEQRTEELKEANASLERLSREDSLTGLANRRWFAEFVARAWQSALRDKTPLCILIVDIDDFKAFNDNYGRQKGDGCLKLVAETIRRAVGRASDLVSRYGGEEFVVVLGDTPLEGGLKIAENIRAAVEGLRIAHTGAGNEACVTVSIGVTSTLPTSATQPETVLVAADRAMYRAKNDGKNRVAYSTAARTGTYQALCTAGAMGTRPS